MNIDLGWLGKVVLEERLVPFHTDEGFVVLYAGCTDSGIPVFGVVDTSSHTNYPKIWRNSILIKVC